MGRANKQILFNIASASTTALGSFIAGMSLNTWTQFSTMGALTHTITNSNNDADCVVSFATRGSWDSQHNEIVFVGQAHSTNKLSLVLRYTESTNAWDNSIVPEVPTGTLSHNFTNQDSDGVGTTFWHNSYSTGVVFKRPYNGAWAQLPLGPTGGGSSGELAGTVWNPSGDTGRGSLLYGSDYGISEYYPRTNAWFTRWAGFGAGGITLAEVSPNAIYDPASGSVFFIGGTPEGGQTAVTKVSATGVVTQMGAAPTQVYVPSATSTAGVAVSGYTTPSGKVKKPMIIQPSVGMWEYTSGTDTWASMGIVPPASSTSDNALFYIPIPGNSAAVDYNVIMWVDKTNANGDCIARLFKRT